MSSIIISPFGCVILNNVAIIDDLPAPVRPTIPIFSPDSVSKLISFRTGGSSSALIQPLLDNQIGLKNQENAEPRELTIDEAKKIIKDVFISAAERDIYCGDAVVIQTITKDGIQEEKFDLRKD